jgi:hypothetical protein
VAALVLVLTTSDEQQIMTNQRIRTTAVAAKEQPSKMTKATMSMTSQRIRVAVAVKEQPYLRLVSPYNVDTSMPSLAQYCLNEVFIRPLWDCWA